MPRPGSLCESHMGHLADTRMTLVPVTLHEANIFVAAHHRHNRPVRGCRFCLGALEDGELVGVAIVGRPVARMIDQRLTAEILRTCVRPGAPRNANSFLYAACRRAWQAMGGRWMHTYTLESESGASLRGAGFTEANRRTRSGWDTPSRPRRPGTVDGVGKVRWETPCKNSEGSGR